MPEHAHLLVYPSRDSVDVIRFQSKLKERVARLAIAFLTSNAPDFLRHLRAKDKGQRARHRFWQPGGGYDRNVVEITTLQRMIDYIHLNPIRRGLVEKATAWQWSSVRWYHGKTEEVIPIDPRPIRIMSADIDPTSAY